MATANVGEIVTTTLRHRNKELADNILNHNALLDTLKKKGHVKTFDGGREIAEELEYAENATAGWYTDWEKLDTTVQDVFDSATFDIKQLAGTVAISGLEEMKNNGSSATINLLSKRISNLKKSLSNKLSVALYSDGTTSNQVGGLRHIVSDTPSASATVGGIAQDTYSWWRNQATNITFSSSDILSKMNAMHVLLVRGVDNPDFIVADSNAYVAFEDAMQGIQRITSDEKGSSGFTHYLYKKAKVFYDENCPSDHMYFLNTDYLYLRPHSDRQFKPLDERHSADQDGKIIPVVWGGNLTCSNRQLQGVLYS